MAAYLQDGLEGVLRDDLIDVGPVQTRLVVGTSPAHRPVWLDHVESLTDVQITLTSQQLYGVLLIPLDGWVYALAWGGGRHLLDDELVDQAFGLMFGIRRLDASNLGNVARGALDATARQIQTSFPSGSDLGGFGVEPYGEIVNRLIGCADLDGLSYHAETGRKHQIRVGTALWAPMSREPGALLADLRAIGSIVDQPDDDSDLRFLMQVRPIDRRDPILTTLEHRLASALGGESDANPLGLGWPPEALREIETAGSFKILRLGCEDSFVIENNIELSELTTRFSSMRHDARMEHLRSARVVVCADGGGQDAVSGQIPMTKWIAFETTVDNVRYCFHHARWFRIGDQYVSQIREQVARLLDRRSDLSFPTWVPSGESDDEHRYCQLTAQREGFLCLDKDLARTPFHPRFELCDLVGPSGEMIHVKWLGRATAASHLYTQAEVSASALRDEPEAREQLAAKVRKLDPSRSIPESPTVVLAIAGRNWSVDQLFTLSQVGLLRLHRTVRFLGADLQFAEIPYVKKQSRCQQVA